MVGMHKAALIVIVVLLFSGLAQGCLASVFPDPGPDLPRIYIRNNGSIEPETASIEKTGNVYTLTEDVVLYTVEIQCSNIVFDGKGYTIQGNASRLKGYDEGNNGIIVEDQDNVTIKGTNFEQGDTGIRLWSSSNISITGNSFVNGLTTGVLANESSFVRIENNIFRNVGKWDYFGSQAILCEGRLSRFNTIKNNNLTDVGNGITLEGYANTITDNKIEATNPIRMSRADSNTISRNKISGRNIGSEPDLSTANEGIWVFADCSDNTIFGNEITGFRSKAIRITYGSNNTVFGNYFANNEFAINLDGDATDTKVYGNTFTADSCKIKIYEVEDTKWDNGTIGNYWGNYNGTDANSDAIGDTPYVIDENNQDNYPLTEPYLGTEYPSPPEEAPWAADGFFPEPNSVNVPVDTVISISFGRPPSTIELTITPEAAVKQKTTENVGICGELYTFHFEEDLEPFTTYNVTIQFGAPNSTKTWTFTTETEQQTQPTPIDDSIDDTTLYLFIILVALVSAAIISLHLSTLIKKRKTAIQ